MLFSTSYAVLEIPLRSLLGVSRAQHTANDCEHFTSDSVLYLDVNGSAYFRQEHRDIILTHSNTHKPVCMCSFQNY